MRDVEALELFLEGAPTELALVAHLRRVHGMSGYDAVIAAHLLLRHGRPADEVLALRSSELNPRHRELPHEEAVTT